jgi:predicted ferric reductase
MVTRADWIDGPWRLQLKGLGSVIGVAGYSLFSLSLFLSSRWPKLEDWFGGLDQIYHTHHQFGIWGFILILIHPFVMGAKWLPQRIDKFLWFIFPVHARLSVNFGSIAFWLMVFIIGVTIIKIFPYDKWKITHKFMSLVFLFASYHILFSENSISSSPISQNLMYIPFLMGLSGILYKQVFVSFFKKNPVFRVVKTKRINDNVVEVELVPERGKIDYIPGQYVFFSFQDDQLTKESHPFTLTGAAKESQISILIKSRGDYTNSLYRHLTKGSKAHLEGPYGRFDYKKAGKSQIWVAGGIGIAPFIAWVRAMRASGDDRSIDLFYCFHRKRDPVFVEKFEQASRDLPNFRYFLFCSEENNRINAQKIMTLSEGFQGKDILMCGPKRLTYELTSQLKALGVRSKNIFFEDFEFF